LVGIAPNRASPVAAVRNIMMVGSGIGNVMANHAD